MLKLDSSRGFTLVELLLAVTILGILIAFGAPSLTSYMQGSKLAAASNTYYAAIQNARAEAIRRNVPVQFVLTDTPVSTANIENAVVSNPSGKSWIIRNVIDPTAAAPTYALIDTKSGREGSARPSSAISVTSIGPVGYVGVITFGGLGTPTVNGTPATGSITVDLSNPSGGACAPTGQMRCPRIHIAVGGQISNCDPIVTSAGDSRLCPP